MDGKDGWPKWDDSHDSDPTGEPPGEDWGRHHRHRHHRHHDDDGKGWGGWGGWGGDEDEDEDGDRMRRMIGLSVGAVLLVTFVIIAIFSIVCIMKRKRARMVNSEKCTSVCNGNAYVGEKKPPLPAGDVWTGPPATVVAPPPYSTLVVDKIPEKPGGGYLDPVPTTTVPMDNGVSYPV